MRFTLAHPRRVEAGANRAPLSGSRDHVRICSLVVAFGRDRCVSFNDTKKFVKENKNFKKNWFLNHQHQTYRSNDTRLIYHVI